MAGSRSQAVFLGGTAASEGAPWRWTTDSTCSGRAPDLSGHPLVLVAPVLAEDARTATHAPAWASALRRAVADGATVVLLLPCWDTTAAPVPSLLSARAATRRLIGDVLHADVGDLDPGVSSLVRSTLRGTVWSPPAANRPTRHGVVAMPCFGPELVVAQRTTPDPLGLLRPTALEVGLPCETFRPPVFWSYGRGFVELLPWRGSGDDAVAVEVAERLLVLHGGPTLSSSSAGSREPAYESGGPSECGRGQRVVQIVPERDEVHLGAPKLPAEDRATTSPVDSVASGTAPRAHEVPEEVGRPVSSGSPRYRVTIVDRAPVVVGQGEVDAVLERAGLIIDLYGGWKGTSGLAVYRRVKRELRRVRTGSGAGGLAPRSAKLLRLWITQPHPRWIRGPAALVAERVTRGSDEEGMTAKVFQQIVSNIRAAIPGVEVIKSGPGDDGAVYSLGEEFVGAVVEPAANADDDARGTDA